MDQAIKDALLERLRGYLDGLDADAGGEPSAEETGEAADLFSVFVEIAAARNEMRTQSCLAKDVDPPVPRRVRDPAVESTLFWNRS